MRRRRIGVTSGAAFLSREGVRKGLEKSPPRELSARRGEKSEEEFARLTEERLLPE
jgi:hypothetical protein